MKEPVVKISVIVTIHNAEKYIRECLDSARSQTFSDIEILCMDGGSMDATPQILSQYAKKDRRIRIINDSNTSYGHKVNRGIAEAKGTYISVLESDDMYEPFMLESLYRLAEQYHTDFVNGDYTCFFDVNGKRFKKVTKMYPKKDYNRLMENKKHPEEFGIIPRYWTGLFRKDYLEREHIRMNESPGASYQDMSFRFLTSVLAETSYHLDLPVYLYRVDNPGSSMYDSKKTVVIADEHDFLKRELEMRGITDPYIWHNAYQWKYTDFRGNMRHLKGEYRQELFDRYREELEKDREAMNQYIELGYNQNVWEMITESPEDIKEKIEQETVSEKKRNEDLYEFLDWLTRLPDGQGIVVFGCGQRGKAVLEYLGFAELPVCCMADNAEELWGTVKWGYAVLSPGQAVERYPDACYIVANKYHSDDILRQLSGYGIKKIMKF